MDLFGPLEVLLPVTTAPDEDGELVTQFQNGDTLAFSQLFRRHQGSVARLIARMMGEPFRRHQQVTELEDLVQDVFVQVYRSLPNFRGNSKVSTWIYRIAVNVVLMNRRAARSRPLLSSADDCDTSASPERNPDEEVARRANIEALYRLLSQISEKKRTVYILHEIEGLSAGEVAEIVGAPVLTVRTRLFYARRELLTLLRDDPHLSAVLSELEAETSRRGQREKPPSERARYDLEPNHEDEPIGADSSTRMRNRTDDEQAPPSSRAMGGRNGKGLS
jgi:RNA polymerase sigma-70 factor (ECF subfamily)